MKVKIGVSARHVHICEKDFVKLFGEDCKLTKKADLYQKGEFACNETVTIEGPRGKIENVRILGPFRNYTQVEISKTDAYILGLNPPIRNSGDIKNSESIILSNGDKKLNLKEGCIIATRHLHMSEKDSFKLGFYNNEIAKIKISGEKGAVLNNVYIKVSRDYKLEMHLDLDDANATLTKTGDFCEVIKDE